MPKVGRWWQGAINTFCVRNRNGPTGWLPGGCENNGSIIEDSLPIKRHVEAEGIPATAVDANPDGPCVYARLCDRQGC